MKKPGFIVYWVKDKFIQLCPKIMMETEMPENINMLKDICPDDHTYLTFLKKVFRHQFRKSWFRRITPSHIEDLATFEKAYAWNKDLLWNLINTDEWTVFSCDPSVSIMRSYIENEMTEAIQPLYFYYMEKVFSKTAEKREIFNIGVEIIGEKDPILDSQIIFIAYTILQKIGLWDDLRLRVNTYGNEKEITKYTEQIHDFYENKKHMLRPETLEKFELDPFSVFHSDDEDEQILAKSMLPITKFLKKDSKAHYASFKEYLDLLEISYEEDHTLFLDENYYSHTMWTIEDVHGKVLIKGWRHDKLSERLIGDKVVHPACGFSLDAEALITLLREKNISIKNKDKIDLYFAQLGDEAKKAVLPLSLEARAAGINTMVSLWTPSIKEQMIKSQRIGASFVVIVGIMEARSWTFQVRDIEAGTQEEVKKEELIEYIIGKIGKENLDFYAPERDLLTK